jgi:hypothetical protein
MLITILGKTRCVLLHFDSSKLCVCPLYKFLYAFKFLKLILKYPVYIYMCVCVCVFVCMSSGDTDFETRKRKELIDHFQILVLLIEL